MLEDVGKRYHLEGGVLALGYFVHETIPNREAVFLRKPGSPVRRNMFSEWFFIDNAKIHLVYSAMFYPPSDQPVPNWPPYDGNWPLPASLAPANP